VLLCAVLALYSVAADNNGRAGASFLLLVLALAT
jgi:hypothetical protein